jgi:signal transduction histidine kinase
MNTGKTLRYFDSPKTDMDESLTDAARRLLTPHEIETIDLVNETIASFNDVAATLEFLFTQTQDLFPCDRIGLAFIEEGGTRLHLRHVLANYEPLLMAGGYNADIRGGSLEKIYRDSAPRIINDLATHAAATPESESTTLLLREGVMSSMTCPLHVDGRPVALLFRSSRKKNVYTEKEVVLHLLISRRLSQAIEKTYRIEELSTAMNSYMEMLGFVTHELKSPVDSIITMARTMSGGYLGELTPQQRDYLERIIKKAQHLSAVAGEYLNLSRFESASVTLKARDCDFAADIADEALDIIAPQAGEKNTAIEKNYAAPLPLQCDPALLKIVMVNILSNAVKYGNDRGLVRVSATAGGGRLEVSVWNAGPGFSDDEKQKLFRKFSRLESRELQSRKGSGIGLYTSWKIIPLHEGRISARSQKGEWAEFSFSVPLKHGTSAEA